MEATEPDCEQYDAAHRKQPSESVRRCYQEAERISLFPCILTRARGKVSANERSSFGFHHRASLERSGSGLAVAPTAAGKRAGRRDYCCRWRQHGRDGAISPATLRSLA